MIGSRDRHWVVRGALSLLVSSACLVAAAAPKESDVQGLYRGSLEDAHGKVKIEARVVAQGDNTYHVLMRQLGSDGKIVRSELSGKPAGDDVVIAGKVGGDEWNGRYCSGAIEFQRKPGSPVVLRRIVQDSPAVGKRAPAGAIVLIDGKNFSEMVRQNGAPWDLDPLKIGKDGSIQVPPGGMTSKRAFPGSVDLHVEFQIPLMPAEHSQARGNSGVFLPNSDEIQVLDSFGETTYLGGGCGGIYRYIDPDTMDTIESLKDKPECKYTLASLPPLAWQTYDIEYRVATKDDKPVGSPRVTVFHNGVKIHDNVEIHGASISYSPPGKLHFQDHLNPVRYRNIWVLPR